ncbi:2-dehydro-3-deoxyphosphogluconate aldolase/(4S)-4-hydroxy-2-oxoglutarate aldolase [Clostridium beijerinckii]|uniref:bifunctional 4-hydroxy-2-oxoglutarate aldolase/2-dehydro-3-deoxy-phosphogluconate aldolase n=1 Tax=Clostridium beijerinckii TaxID=1520 RepID=UPI0030FE7209|nr:2-dehydro-3-deoxyphosphogluconate aldolase/(4S)-4-hydroxy-2-oxoglutarate aldolase [Clostridium beijerinckii]
MRGDSKEEALKIVDAVSKGGIKVMELTMTVPNPVEVIKEVAEKYKDTDVIVGAGTVLDSETARACILAGAQFIVSPSLDIDTLKLCNRYKILVMPGVMTVKDAITAFEYGVDVVKIFPANLYGPSVIKSFKGPLPQGDFMPTGGVSIANLHEWIEAGAFVVGTGGDLTKGAKTGDYDLVQRTAKEFMDAYRKAKERI